MKQWMLRGVLLWGVGLLSACWGETPERKAPDIVLVLANGIRAQAGDSLAEEGFFEAMALQGGRVFSAAYAQSPHPVSSLASMLAGEYPSAIPFCTPPRTQKEIEEPWCTQLPPERRLLPEILDLYGYNTGLFVVGQLGELARLGGRFEHVSAGPTAGLAQELGAWWEAQRDTPRFVVLVVDQVPALRRTDRLGARGGEIGSVLQDAYRKQSRETGQWVGALLSSELSESDSRGRVVVVTSAHGLSLAETTGTSELPITRVFHDILLDRTTHVPLRVFGAGDEKDVVTPVQLIDLVPALTGLAGAVAPADLPGRDLLGHPPGSGWAYAEFGDMLLFREGERLLGMRMLEHGASSLDPRITEQLEHGVEPQVRFTLYDVERDPMQTRDLAGTHPEHTARLRQELIRLRQGSAMRSPGMSREQIEALRNAGALDYW